MSMRTLNSHRIVSSSHHETDKFETDFANFEQNRMYPPGYRKDTAMRKVTGEHVGAVARAEGYMHQAIVPNMTIHHRQYIESDLIRLTEVKQFILKAIYEPGLPLCAEIPKEPKDDGNAS